MLLEWLLDLGKPFPFGILFWPPVIGLFRFVGGSLGLRIGLSFSKIDNILEDDYYS